MDQKQIAKQMIQFNKTALDNSFRAMTMVFDQNQKMVETMLQQATWLPENGRKAIDDWMSAFKTGCDDFKKLLDDSYAKVETFFNSDQ